MHSPATSFFQEQAAQAGGSCSGFANAVDTVNNVLSSLVETPVDDVSQVGQQHNTRYVGKSDSSPPKLSALLHTFVGKEGWFPRTTQSRVGLRVWSERWQGRGTSCSILLTLPPLPAAISLALAPLTPCCMPGPLLLRMRFPSSFKTTGTFLVLPSFL